MKQIAKIRIYMKYVQNEITNYNRTAVNVDIMYHTTNYLGR